MTWLKSFEVLKLSQGRRRDSGNGGWLWGILGDAASNPNVPGRPGWSWVRFPAGVDDVGVQAYYPPVAIAEGIGASFLKKGGRRVWIGLDPTGQPEIVRGDRQDLAQIGITGAVTNPLNREGQQPNRANPFVPLTCEPVNTTNTPGFLVTVFPLWYDTGSDIKYFPGTEAAADKPDLASFVPGSDDEFSYVVIWLDTDTNALETPTASTATAFDSTFGNADIITALEECYAAKPNINCIPIKAFYLDGSMTNLTQSAKHIDLRQMVNMPSTGGGSTPPFVDTTAIVKGSADATKLLRFEVDGFTTATTRVLTPPNYDGTIATLAGTETLTNKTLTSPTIADFTNAQHDHLDADDGGTLDAAAIASGTFNSARIPALPYGPDSATYITQTPSSGLSAEQAMSALATGIVKNTTTTGVQSIAVADTDYTTPTGLEAAIALLTTKRMVLVATAAALPANTYANGTSGVGATLTASANGALTVDGVTVAVGNRVLVKDEASGLKNGIYAVTATGSGGAPYVLTRTTDADTSDELRGCAVIPLDGTANKQILFQNTNTTAITLGTTAITFSNLINFANRALSNLTGTSITAVLQPASPGGSGLGTDPNYFGSAYIYSALFPDTGSGSAPSGFIQLFGKVSGNDGVLFTEDDNNNELQLTPQTAIVTHSVASGTSAGGTTANTWVNRPLNTEAYDPYQLLTISSNRATLVAGVYRIWVYATVIANASTATVAVHRLYNHTQSLEIAKSPTARLVADTGAPVAWETTWTANGTDEIRVDTYATQTRATNGLGQPATTGSNEIFTILAVRKIG